MVCHSAQDLSSGCQGHPPAGGRGMIVWSQVCIALWTEDSVISYKMLQQSHLVQHSAVNVVEKHNSMCDQGLTAPCVHLHIAVTIKRSYPMQLSASALVATGLTMPLFLCQTFLHMTTQARASRLSFSDILKRLAALPSTEPIFICKQVPNNQCWLIAYCTVTFRSSFTLYGLTTINSLDVNVSTFVYLQKCQ